MRPIFGLLVLWLGLGCHGDASENPHHDARIDAPSIDAPPGDAPPGDAPPGDASPADAPASDATPTDAPLLDAMLCGNSMLDPGELCDGVNHGGITCASFGYTGGVLVCQPDCMSFNMAGCTS